MTPLIHRFLLGYTARRRTVALICAIGWAAAFAVGWLIFCSELNQKFQLNHAMRVSERVIGGIICIGIFARPIFFLFSRINPVITAIEIEKHQPVFDQRLITIASQPQDSDLLKQLKSEVDDLLAEGKGRTQVSVRSLLAPALALIAAVLLALWFFKNEKQARPSGPSLNRVWQIWDGSISRSEK